MIRPRAERKQAFRPRFTKGLYEAAIAELENALETVKTNEPINRKEGDAPQADLEKENAASFKAGITLMRKQK